MARVTLIASWATIAAKTAVRAVLGMVAMTVAAQSAAKIVSAPKLPANATRPTSMTSHEARVGVREKNIGQHDSATGFFLRLMPVSKSLIQYGSPLIAAKIPSGCLAPRRGQKAQQARSRIHLGRLHSYVASAVTERKATMARCETHSANQRIQNRACWCPGFQD